MVGREREIVRHLSEDDLDRLQKETDDAKISKRLTFIKRLYKGATIEGAADDVGMSQSTGSRWVTRWNKGGLGLLTPNFGGGQPPKLDETEQQRFLDLLEEGEPWTKPEIHHLLKQEFDVEYHPNHLPRVLDKLGVSHAVPRTKRPDRPENAEEILDERVADAFDESDSADPHNKRSEDDGEQEWTVDEDVQTDGGTVVGFFDISHPQPWDNSQRLYTVSEPTITRPLVKIETPAAGFYALTGNSVLSFPLDQTKEQICDCLDRIRDQNPGKRILVVLDNFSSHVCAYTRRRAHNRGIDLVFLPVGSPDLNPIESVWKSLRWESSPLIVEDEDEYRSLLDQIFTALTQRLSFATSWITNHLSEYIQKLR